MSKKRTIQNALPIVATAYGEKFGVKVQIGGDMAYTDGQTIVVPNIPDDYPHKDSLWGYLAHEAAHVRFTDFTVRWRKGLHQALTNIIEDCRIEREMIKLYPGTAHTLNEVARHMASAGHYQVPTDNSPAAFILEGFCLYHLQCRVVGQDVIQDLLDRTREVFERKFPKGTVVRLNALLRKATQLQSTQQAADLADAIIKMVEKEAEKQDPQPLPQDQAQPSPDTGDDDSDATGDAGGDDDSSQDQDDASGQGGGQGDDDSTQPSDQAGASGTQGDDEDASDGQDAMSGHQNQQAGTDGGAARSADTQDGDSASQVLQQVLGAGDDDHMNDAHDSLKGELQQVAHDDGDRHYQSIRQAVQVDSRDQEGKAMRDEVKRTTSRIRTQLMGLVQASQRTGHRTARHGKRIDARQLHRLSAGDTRVFRRDTPKRKPNTAVHILVDMSGSMGHQAANGKHRYQIASEASMAIGLALEPIQGVNPAVTFFGGHSNRPVFEVVRHGQRVAPQAGRFVFSPVGTTPMAEAMWFGAYQLVQTIEERKMLIVVTDGDPDNAAACRAVTELCEAGGVELIGIGVETISVSRLFENHIVIEDVADLQRTLFRLMERSLTAPSAA